MQVEFEAFCGPKFMTFWDAVGDPSKVSTHLTDCLYHVTFRRYRPLKLPYRPLKLPLSCKVGQKGKFWASDL